MLSIDCDITYLSLVQGFNIGTLTENETPKQDSVRLTWLIILCEFILKKNFISFLSCQRNYCKKKIMKNAESHLLGGK